MRVSPPLNGAGRRSVLRIVVPHVPIGLAIGAEGDVHGALELTERFSLDPQTQALKREVVANDPLFFREPYTGSDVVHPSNVTLVVSSIA